MTIAKTMVAVALVAACGSDSSSTKKDAAIDTPRSAGATLTVKNAPTSTPWCSVSVAGQAASSTGVQTMTIASSGPITLVATPLTGFELSTNMWHHTDGDTGSGEAGTVSGSMSTATVTVTTGVSKCVWVCCPFQSPPGTGCPTTDQCP